MPIVITSLLPRHNIVKDPPPANDILGVGRGVGIDVGIGVGISVGSGVGIAVGTAVGIGVGTKGDA